MDGKECRTCNEVKAVSEFTKNKRNKDGLNYECKACAKTRRKAWEEANPGKREEYNRTAYRKRKYGVIRPELTRKKELEAIGMKECSHCHQVKPINEFYKENGAADGHAHRCKECAIEVVKASYERNKEKVREYRREQRAFFKTAKEYEWLIEAYKAGNVVVLS